MGSSHQKKRKPVKEEKRRILIINTLLTISIYKIRKYPRKFLCQNFQGYFIEIYCFYRELLYITVFFIRLFCYNATPIILYSFVIAINYFQYVVIQIFMSCICIHLASIIKYHSHIIYGVSVNFTINIASIC